MAYHKFVQMHNRGGEYVEKEWGNIVVKCEIVLPCVKVK
jgi:hypothetical protein